MTGVYISLYNPEELLNLQEAALRPASTHALAQLAICALRTDEISSRLDSYSHLLRDAEEALTGKPLTPQLIEFLLIYVRTSHLPPPPDGTLTAALVVELGKDHGELLGELRGDLAWSELLVTRFLLGPVNIRHHDFAIVLAKEEQMPRLISHLRALAAVTRQNKQATEAMACLLKLADFAQSSGLLFGVAA